MWIDRPIDEKIFERAIGLHDAAAFTAKSGEEYEFPFNLTFPMPTQNQLPETELPYLGAAATEFLPPTFYKAYQEAAFNGVSSARVEYFIHLLVEIPGTHTQLHLSPNANVIF